MHPMHPPSGHLLDLRCGVGDQLPPLRLLQAPAWASYPRPQDHRDQLVQGKTLKDAQRLPLEQSPASAAEWGEPPSRDRVHEKHMSYHKERYTWGELSGTTQEPCPSSYAQSANKPHLSAGHLLPQDRSGAGGGGHSRGPARRYHHVLGAR